MMSINYNDKRFRSIRNSGSGEVGADTIFHYHQHGNIVTAEYSGGDIVQGHLMAICDDDGGLDMSYHHVNRRGELMTGTCESTPEILEDGRIKLFERWQWTCG